MRFFIFATIFISVLTLLTFFIHKRFINKLSISKKIKNFLNIFLIVNLVGVFLYMCTRYLISVPNEIYFLLSLSIGVIFLLFCTTVIYEIISHLPKISKDENRRVFLKKSVDLASLALATSVTTKAVYNAKDSYVEKIDIKIENLEEQYSIVQLSDVHIGGLIDKEFISNIVNKVNHLNADLVVITGDLIDTDLDYVTDVVDELKNLKSKYGTFFIVGNHEYFHKIEKIIPYLKSININVLENENVYIGEKSKGFNLVGVYDVFGYRYEKYIPNIKKALENKQNSPTILLAHQPKYIYETEKYDIDLMLSGHTHGGQIVPFNLLVRIAQPYIRGLYRHNKKTQVYVNKGTGFWGPPMRLGTNAEITLIRLRG